MIENPPVVQVALTKDWPEAFQLAWIATFKIAAREMGMPVDDVAIEMGETPVGWDERRAACRRFVQRFANFGDPETAGAWAMLVANPTILPAARAADDEKALSIALIGLASAVTKQPDLLSDGAFAKAVFGWRFLERHGRLSQTGEDDPIIVARAIGASITVDRDDMLDWAKAMLEERR